MTSPSLPVVRKLPPGFDVAVAFDRLGDMPRRIWLDSNTAANTGQLSEAASIDPAASVQDTPRGRYSFLAADPVRTLDVHAGAPAPWDDFQVLAKSLPPTNAPELPPFQGGIAGLIGYEAGTWLENVGTSRIDDLPTPAISLGVYDWVIAVDHINGEAWLVSQGLGADDESQRETAARQRADAVMRCLESSNDATPAYGKSAGKALSVLAKPTNQFATQHTGVTSSFTGAGFRGAVADIVQRIRGGDCFQVNLAQRLLRQADCCSSELYHRLRKANPAPMSGYYDGGDFQVLSSSPEGFLQVRGGRVETRPIKGTVPRTGDDRRDEELAQQLRESKKDHAENVMIVDLMRNDLSRVCEDDSVEVEKLCKVERYRYVQHLVSVVTGRLRADQDVVDLLRACFPGGSITGAPKIEAMKTIATLEPNPRGPYCGSLGYISCGGNADFNILIRTITATRGYWQIPVGGGITARSEPAGEEAETWSKAEGMLRAVQIHDGT
ncbi:anthranilate synthase component I family protein [Stieleria varia]|uniref:Aminodeoxychorismate synthase component 1 n=1 Tax=Stieleria varia TaxID=2528005 RepID=A0A5C6AZI8_9BACT|nr:anthranilate synthase component I family protein [Stieleria varia]TWU05475.1 Aminodeoxychorismate synthase component 1 [Stieleria varia]